MTASGLASCNVTDLPDLQNGNTALDKAVQYEHWEVVELLVAVGAMSGEGLLEMFFESCRDDGLEKVQKLLQDGIGVDVPDEVYVHDQNR